MLSNHLSLLHVTGILDYYVADGGAVAKGIVDPAGFIPFHATRYLQEGTADYVRHSDWRVLAS